MRAADVMTENEELERIFFVAESTVHGKGLFARIDIAKGEYLGTYQGPEVNTDDEHVLWVEDDTGQWCGRDGENMLRYLNHSLEPYAEFDGFDLYAMRDISSGVEITINYGDEY